MTFSSYCKTSRGKPKQILLITMLCVTLFSTLQMQTVEAAFEDLGLDFDEIHIVTSVSEKSIRLPIRFRYISPLGFCLRKSSPG